MRCNLWPGLAIAALLQSPPARGDAKADARALYDQGAAAFDAGDYPRAASLLADADALAPNPLVLRFAIGATLKAGDPVLGEDLALRADARGATGEVAESAAQAHARFRARVGRVRIVCREGRSCAAHIGSIRWLGGELHAVAPGIVDVVFDGSVAHVRTEVGAGTVADIVEPPSSAPASPSPAALKLAPKPTEPREPPSPPSRGLPPLVFWVGVAVTGALAGATVASGLDAQARHDDFIASRTPENQSAGESAVVRTNVLLGSAIVGAAATAVVGLFFTQWRSGPRAATSAWSGRIAW